MLEFFCSTPNFDGYALYTKSLATCGYLHKSLYALDEMELQCHYEIPHSLVQYVANEAACGRTETELTVKTFMSRFAEQNKPVRPLLTLVFAAKYLSPCLSVVYRRGLQQIMACFLFDILPCTRCPTPRSLSLS